MDRKLIKHFAEKVLVCLEASMGCLFWAKCCIDFCQLHKKYLSGIFSRFFTQKFGDIVQ